MVGPGLGLQLTLFLAWRRAGTDETSRAMMKRLAFACRYGHAGEWVLTVPTWFLQDFVDAVGVIVEEENPPRK